MMGYWVSAIAYSSVLPLGHRASLALCAACWTGGGGFSLYRRDIDREDVADDVAT
jgi:hypothetical protein